MEFLEDLNVIEIGSTVVGPYASQALGALGAEIVKIEPPSGDPFRSDEQQDETIYPYFAMCNCEKRSLKIDLKQDDGREIFLELSSQADVIIENFRPGVVDKLGISYEDVSEVNENIVYCGISGYGEESPWRNRAAFDPMLQGITGLMSTTGEKRGEPVRIGVALIDLVTGLWSVVAVLSSLWKRRRTHEGSFIDMRMYDVGISLLTKKAARYFDTGKNPPRMGLESLGSHPYAGYPTKDDKIIMVGAPFPAHWERFCNAIEREDFIDDDRFATGDDRLDHREELNEILEQEFRTRTRDEWEEIFLGYELPVGPVHSVEEALNSEFSRANDTVTEVNHPEYGSVNTLNLPLVIDGKRQEFTSPPPTVGEHSREVLTDAGISEEAIAELEKNNII